MENTEQKLYIPASIADNLPAMVRNELAKLSAQKQEEFIEEYQRKKKSAGIAYVLLIVFFLLGFHYLYVKKIGLWVAFFLTAGGFGIWWLIDLFRLAGVVKNYNRDVATDVMRNLQAISK